MDSRIIERRVSLAALQCPQPDMMMALASQGEESPVSRLERSAEELSQGGSDIGLEIKRMRERERSASNSTTTTSRRSSTRSRLQGLRKSQQAFNANSTASNNIVDINNNARWGGYSPGAHIASPTGSSGSWSHASVNRAGSGSRSSFPLAHVVEPTQEGRPLDSPLARSAASIYPQERQMSLHASQSSFGHHNDHLASEIEASLIAVPPTPTAQDQASHEQHHDEPVTHASERRTSTDTFREAQIAFKDFDGVHFDPDREEFVEVDDRGNEIRRVSARTSSGSLLDAASLLRAPRARPISYGVPPPGEGMVYYPAPVPRMLNMPKRLSQGPSPHIQAQRRSQMLAEMPREARESAPWIPHMGFSENGPKSQTSGSGSTSQHDHPRPILNERMSMHNASNLPPQLRATMYFEHPSVEHNVEVQLESAVATLDAILASSATAPVTAFTDHPFAGDVRKTVYGPERFAQGHNRRSTATTLAQVKEEGRRESTDKKARKRRSSSLGRLLRRKSTDLDGETEQKRTSRGSSMLDLNGEGSRLRKRRSQMSMDDMSAGDDYERVEGPGTAPATEYGGRSRRQSGLIGAAANANSYEERRRSGTHNLTESERELEGIDQIEQDFRDAEADEVDDSDVMYAQPTTLLAELQVRKAQLRSRNKTAAKAFPNGMHSTLLQMDAVEQIEARKRQKKKISLAWEDHGANVGDPEDNGENEDVPLGMLFPSKNGAGHRKMGDGQDWNRPLGLMERRELEDNEPLANRRMRMNPHARPMIGRGSSQVQLVGDQTFAGEPEIDEHEGETLGQRLRRLKTKDALDAAISDVTPKEGQRPDSTFAESILDQFGGVDVEGSAPKDKGKDTANEDQATPGVDAEESLGQRRARLQREREASDEGPQHGPERPPLRTSNSLANLLSSNPIGTRSTSQHKFGPAQGTLLHASHQHQLQQKQDLVNVNIRSSSYMLDKSFVNARPHTSGQPTGGLLSQTPSRPAKGAYHRAAYGAAGYMMGSEEILAKNPPYGGLIGDQRSTPVNGAFAGGFFNNNGGGVGQQTSMFGMAGGNGYAFASPTAGMSYGIYGAGGNPSMTGYGEMQVLPPGHGLMNNAAYFALNGGHASVIPAGYPNGLGYATQPTHMTYGAAVTNPNGMGVMGDLPLDPNQRAAIDRWRLGIGA